MPSALTNVCTSANRHHTHPRQGRDEAASSSFYKNVVPKTGLEPVSLAAADFKSDVYTIPPLGPTIRHRAMKVVLGNTVMINGKNCLRSLLLRLYVGF